MITTQASTLPRHSRFVVKAWRARAARLARRFAPMALILGLLPAGQAAAQVSFGNCPVGAFQTLYEQPRDAYGLYAVNIATGALTRLGSDVELFRINAIGFNQDDGFIYGFDSANRQIVRIGQGGNSAFLGPPIAGLPSGTIAAPVGDVRNGNLIFEVSRDGVNPPMTLVEVALTGPNANTVVRTIPNAPFNGGADFAENPLDGRLYGVAQDGTLRRTDPTTGTVTTVPGIVLPNPGNSFFGATYFDNEGTLYASRNDGSIFRILHPDGSQTPTFEVLTTTAPPTAANDGARCNDAPPPVASLHTRKGLTTQSIPNNSADPGELLTYTVTMTNTGLAPNTTPAQFFDAIPAGTTLQSITGATTDCPIGSAGSRLCTVTIAGPVPANGGTRTVSMVFRVDNAFPPGVTQIQNLVTDDIDPVPPGCTATNQPCTPAPACDAQADPEHCVVLRAPTADLIVHKTNTPTQGPSDLPGDTVVTGAQTTYSITITNSGPDAVTGPTITDTPTAGLTCPGANAVTCTGPAGACPAGAISVGQLTGAGVTLGALANGATATLQFTCAVQ